MDIEEAQRSCFFLLFICSLIPDFFALGPFCGLFGNCRLIATFSF